MSARALLHRVAGVGLSVSSRRFPSRLHSSPSLLAAFQSPSRWFAQSSTDTPGMPSKPSGQPTKQPPPSTPTPLPPPRSSPASPYLSTASPVQPSDAVPLTPPPPPLPSSAPPPPISSSPPLPLPSTPAPPPRRPPSASDFAPPPPPSQSPGFLKRLTATEQDRALLDRVMRYTAVILVFSLAANAVALTDTWERWMASLFPASRGSASPPTDEELEDEALVEEIFAQRAVWLEQQRRLEDERRQREALAALLEEEEEEAREALLAITSAVEPRNVAPPLGTAP